MKDNKMAAHWPRSNRDKSFIYGFQPLRDKFSQADPSFSIGHQTTNGELVSVNELQLVAILQYIYINSRNSSASTMRPDSDPFFFSVCIQNTNKFKKF